MIVGLGAGVAVSVSNTWLSVMRAEGTGMATTSARLPLEEPAVAGNANTRMKLATRAKLAMSRMNHRRMETRGSRMELG